MYDLDDDLPLPTHCRLNKSAKRRALFRQYTYNCSTRDLESHPPPPGTAPNPDDSRMRNGRDQDPANFAQLKMAANPKSANAFEDLRDSFMEAFADVLEADLPGWKLHLPQVGSTARERFMRAAAQHQGNVHLGYHGTMARNHDSIYRHGFIVPGLGDLKVRNGATHGHGVYTSVAGSTWLSRQFCDTPAMLVCAVVEDGQSECNRHASTPGTIAGWRIKRDTEHLREVGSARIVKDSAYIVPIATASTAMESGPLECDTSTSGLSPNKAGCPWYGRRRTLHHGSVAWIAPCTTMYNSARSVM